MRNATICLLVVLLGAWTSSVGQNATTRGHYPQVVAKVHLTGQTAVIPQTTLVSPKKDGFYRVSAYIASTYVGYDGQHFGLNMTWTDDGGAESFGGICPYFNGAGSMDAYVWSSVMLFKANTPFSYSVSNTSDCESSITTYSVYLTVERLE
jgi:hypothetical protein